MLMPGPNMSQGIRVVDIFLYLVFAGGYILRSRIEPHRTRSRTNLGVFAHLAAYLPP